MFLPFLLIMGSYSRRAASDGPCKPPSICIDLRCSLGAGTISTSGLEATIVAIADDTIDSEIAPGVVTTWMKLAIRDRILAVDDDIDEELNETLDKDVDDGRRAPVTNDSDRDRNRCLRDAPRRDT